MKRKWKRRCGAGDEWQGVKEGRMRNKEINAKRENEVEERAGERG